MTLISKGSIPRCLQRWLLSNIPLDTPLLAGGFIITNRLGVNFDANQLTPFSSIQSFSKKTLTERGNSHENQE
jgi:hypothetical protein